MRAWTFLFSAGSLELKLNCIAGFDAQVVLKTSQSFGGSPLVQVAFIATTLLDALQMPLGSGRQGDCRVCIHFSWFLYDSPVPFPCSANFNSLVVTLQTRSLHAT